MIANNKQPRIDYLIYIPINALQVTLLIATAVCFRNLQPENHGKVKSKSLKPPRFPQSVA